MTLDEITPDSVSSVLQRNWTAHVPSWMAAAGVLLPALIFDWSYRGLSIALAIVAAAATDAGMSKLRHYWRLKDAMTPPPTFPDPPPAVIGQRAERWKAILGDVAARPFVLFSYGTCVIGLDPDGDPTAQAKDLLQRFGHAVPGTPSADMLVYPLADTGDFVVGGHHPDILTYVPRDMLPLDVLADQLPVVVAFCGRDLRVLDTFALNAVYTSRADASQQ